MYTITYISQSQENNLKLWYKKPAQKWVEALPIGNGRLGAMIFGGVSKERLQLNENTLWSGEPKNCNNPGARDVLPEIRKLVFEGKYVEADILSKKMQGPFTQAYMPMGNLKLKFVHNGSPSKYYRELDLDSAIAMTRYIVDGVTFTREIFASYPDQIIAVHITASKKNKISFTATLDSELHYKIIADTNTLILKGKAPLHADPNYYNGQLIYAKNEKGKGINFDLRVKVSSDGGKVTVDNQDLHINSANSVTLIISAATSFNGFNKSPSREGKNPELISKKFLESASKKSYEQLKKNHIRDYQRLFHRVKLNLGDLPDDAKNLTTDKRVVKYGASDSQLVALLFQFGRYLLISSSRPKSQPANLQGIWNDSVFPPWSSNYTTNINTEMNYWPAEVTNLSECHEPLFDFISELAVNGKKTAKINYGCRGWVAHHNSDLWRQTAPVGDYGQGDPVWALWPMAGVWLSQHLWEHYAFTGDKNFLLNKAYPLMKGAAEFCLDWLIDDGNGHLVTSPSTSPEHKFVLQDERQAAISAGSTMDISLIRELFTDCIEASEILGIDKKFRNKLINKKAKLLPTPISKDGRIQEWMYDFKSAEPQHRHLSFLFSLYPGRLITQKDTPELIEAAKKSLAVRGDGGTGWSLGWKINIWARLGDGEHCLKLIGNVLKLSDDKFSGVLNSGGIYPNLFGAHPPFQIDGNFSFTSGVAEMLLQSHENEINLLPALPKKWANGYVKGLCARGGFEVDIEWENGDLKNCVIKSKLGNICKVCYKDKSAEFKTVKGGKYLFPNFSEEISKKRRGKYTNIFP